MKKPLSAFLAALSFVTMSFAADRKMAYVPTSGDGPWEWGDAANWYNRDTKEAINAVPYSSPDEYLDIVYLFSSPLSDKPLQIPSGTVALCKQMFIGSGEQTIAGVERSDRPICVEVCGGVVTNFFASYLGYVNNYWGATRSAKIDISSGSWVSLGDFNIGGGSEFSWLNIGENGSLEVTAATKTLNLGFANYGGVIVTNKGLIKARDIRVSHKYQYGQVFGFSTGIVYNAGSMIATNDFYLGSDTNGYAWIENRGTMEVMKGLYIGNAKDAVSTVENHGTLVGGRNMRLGEIVGSGMSVYRHMAGATLTSLADKPVYYVGRRAPALFSVDGGELGLSNVTEVYIAGDEYNSATNCRMEIVNGGKVTLDGSSITVGLGKESKGALVVDGEGSELTGSLWINVGNWASLNKEMTLGRGDVVVANGGKIRASAIYLGFGGGAVGTLSVTNGGTVEAYSILGIGYSTGAEKGSSTGIVTVAGADSVITNVEHTYVGRFAAETVNAGLLKMEGGSYFYRADKETEGSFRIGVNGNSSAGEIRGWGIIAHSKVLENTWPGRSVFMRHYGKVIADGEGQERDLNFGNTWSQGGDVTDPNLIGCNGWYARNKGRLRMPHLHEIYNGSNSRCVGDHAAHSGDPRMVNSFRFTLSGIERYGYFVWTDLYAPDRSDIPSGLAARTKLGKALAVYRVGYFREGHTLGEPSTPVGFDTAFMKFRYSPDEAKDYPRVRVYRHDGTESGGWRLVGQAEYSAESPLVETSVFEKSSAHWNFGWFAVVADEPRGTVLTVR